jgi:hypothetical protein
MINPQMKLPQKKAFTVAGAGKFDHIAIITLRHAEYITSG